MSNTIKSYIDQIKNNPDITIDIEPPIYKINNLKKEILYWENNQLISKLFLSVGGVVSIPYTDIDFYINAFKMRYNKYTPKIKLKLKKKTLIPVNFVEKNRNKKVSIDEFFNEHHFVPKGSGSRFGVNYTSINFPQSIVHLFVNGGDTTELYGHLEFIADELVPMYRGYLTSRNLEIARSLTDDTTLQESLFNELLLNEQGYLRNGELNDFSEPYIRDRFRTLLSIFLHERNPPGAPLANRRRISPTSSSSTSTRNTRRRIDFDSHTDEDSESEIQNDIPINNDIELENAPLNGPGSGGFNGMCPVCFDNKPENGFSRLNCNFTYNIVNDKIIETKRSGHIICNDCINKWYKSGKNTCPICRAIISYKVPITIPTDFVSEFGKRKKNLIRTILSDIAYLQRFK